MGRTARRQRSTLIVLAAVAGGVLLVCGGAATVYVAAVGYHLANPTAKPLPREEWRQKIMGKTEAEVLRIAGRPLSTSDDGSPTKYWYYREPTYDPVTGNTDWHVQVEFSNGRVVSVNY